MGEDNQKEKGVKRGDEKSKENEKKNSVCVFRSAVAMSIASMFIGAPACGIRCKIPW